MFFLYYIDYFCYFYNNVSNKEELRRFLFADIISVANSPKIISS